MKKSPLGRSEYGRVKIALPPGKGLMDWVRLASSKILARKQMTVDHEELMKHNKRDDCWIHIYGQVYDVTSYLEFHPGGVPELMRAAGTDATDLFIQYHAWVNYENMLKSCFVGRFSGDLSKYDVFFDSESCAYTVTVQNNCVTIDFEDTEVEAAVSLAKLSIKQSLLVVYHEGVIEEKRKVSHDTLLFVVRLPRGLFYPVASGRHVSFKVRKGASVLYRPYTPVSSGSLSDQPVDSGQVKCAEPARIVFMIKIYKDGICTPSLEALNVGDSIEISEPIGCVDMSPWTDTGSELLMLAAGTGLTPMVNIIRERLKRLQKEGSDTAITRLLLFNKSEEDIVSDDWLPMRWTDTHIAPPLNATVKKINIRSTSSLIDTLYSRTVASRSSSAISYTSRRTNRTEHILSNPSQEWDGRLGRIDSTMLPKACDSLRVLICGPDGFNVAASKYVETAYVSQKRTKFQ
uniref:Cytochrome-b5 reductase n=1 Tax=Heligmosomoides polygyrus TaxID=6339 RepID=A0A183GPI7_HELPZ